MSPVVAVQVTTDPARSGLLRDCGAALEAKRFPIECATGGIAVRGRPGYSYWVLISAVGDRDDLLESRDSSGVIAILGLTSSRLRAFFLLGTHSSTPPAVC